MPAAAPITVPVEISPAGSNGGTRVFRLLHRVAVDRLMLGGDLGVDPEWLTGPLVISFHLPGDDAPVTCSARAREVVVDAETETEHAERRALDLSNLPAEAAQRIDALRRRASHHSLIPRGFP
jgi:hypothetical protein